MRRIRYGILMALCLGIGLLGDAEPVLHHTSGLIDMAITDFGSLSAGLIDNTLLTNCWYPLDTGRPAAFLGGLSEVWLGDDKGHVASAVDLTADGTLQRGEWVSVQEPTYLSDGRVVQTILTQYATASRDRLPFNILVDQISTTWNRQVMPEAAGIVVIKFLLTNRSSLDAEGLYFALATDWDLDMSNPNDLNANEDLVEWFPPGQASVMFDGQTEDGVTLVQTATVLIDGKFRAHRILNALDWSYRDRDRSSVMAPGEFVVDTSQSLPGAGDYLSVLSVGPYNLAAGKSRAITYALVMAPNANALIDSIALAHRLALGATQLQAAAKDGRVILSWQGAIAHKTHGYQVLRATSAAGPFEPIGRGVFDRSSYEDRDVTNGTTYYYQLLSLDANGQPVVAMGQPVVSEVVQATPNPLPPAPEALRLQLTHRGVELQWEDVPGAVSYRVYRKVDEASDWILVGETSTSAFVDAELAREARYAYSVVAVNEAGLMSERSASVQLTLPLPEPGQVFEDLSQVRVFPNPFSLRSGQPLVFDGLTPRARIRIYGVEGDPVHTLEHEDGTPREVWYGLNKEGNPVAPGMYVYHIEAIQPGREVQTVEGILSIIP